MLQSKNYEKYIAKEIGRAFQLCFQLLLRQPTLRYEYLLNHSTKFHKWKGSTYSSKKVSNHVTNVWDQLEVPPWPVQRHFCFAFLYGRIFLILLEGKIKLVTFTFDLFWKGSRSAKKTRESQLRILQNYFWMILTNQRFHFGIDVIFERVLKNHFRICIHWPLEIPNLFVDTNSSIKHLPDVALICFKLNAWFSYSLNMQKKYIRASFLYL